MDASDWIALGALAVALAGFGVSVWAIVYSRRSANEARRIREIEADRRTQEKEQRHEALAPNLPGELEAQYQEGPGHAPGEGVLFVRFRVPRMYRVRAFARAGESTEQLHLDVVAKPDRDLEVVIERWHPERTEPRTEEVLFRFWAPTSEDAHLANWHCPCDRWMTGEVTEAEGHWEYRVKVSFAQGPEPWAAFT